MAADDYAIVIGISTYPGLTSLEGPGNDVDLFTGWLRKKDGGNLPKKNISICTSLFCLSKKFDPSCCEQIEEARPNREDIEKLFRPWVKAGKQGNTSGRRLYIFASGHGFGKASDSHTNAMDTALYTANADVYFGLHVAVTAYANWLSQAAVFNEIVLVMDCCRTKNLLHPFTYPVLPNTNHDPEKARKVRKFYAFASPWGNAAKEKRFMERNNRTYGIFTIALLEALAKARPNRLGNVKGETIKKYIHNVIDEIAGDTKVPPPEIDLGNYNDLIWFTREDPISPHKPLVTITLPEFRGNEICRIQNGALEALDSIPFKSERLSVSLEPGLYKFSIEGTDRNKLIQLLNDDIEITI